MNEFSHPKSTKLVSPKSAREWLRRRLGSYSPLLRWYRRLRPRWLWVRTNPSGQITRRYVAEHGLTVRHGPFVGMTYPKDAVGRVNFLPAKLLGAYEAELSGILQRDAWDVCVEVGSGEGYFCVGLARRNPQAVVVGFETDTGERRFCGRLAQLNGVGVVVHGTAGHAELNALPPGRLLLLVDIEGAEYELVNPDLCPRLQSATLIIELHWWERADLEHVLRSRFGETHEISVITQQGDRVLSDFPELEHWPDAMAVGAVSEGRPRSIARWMVLIPKGSSEPPQHR